MPFTRLRGIGVSPGIGMGEISLEERVLFSSRKEVLPQSRLENELKRLRRAVARTRRELLNLQAQVRERMGEEHAFFFDAHLLILQDVSLFTAVEKVVREEVAAPEPSVIISTRKCILKK